MMPELCGTIISENTKLAVLSFRQSPSPLSKTSSKRGKTSRKARRPSATAPIITPRTTDTRIVSVGDRFGDYRLVAIDDKQVTLEYDGQKIQLYTQR